VLYKLNLTPNTQQTTLPGDVHATGSIGGSDIGANLRDDQRVRDLIENHLSDTIENVQTLLSAALTTDPDWLDLTDGGTTTLHRHAFNVLEEDGLPSDTAVTIIRVPVNGLVDNGAGDVSLQYELAGAVSTHVLDPDPHTGYVLEGDPNWVDLTDGGATTLHTHAGLGATITVKEEDGTPSDTAVTEIQVPNGSLTIDVAGTVSLDYALSAHVHDHGTDTGLGDDDHTQYLLASAATDRATFAARWTDLTDGGATTLHSHAGGGTTLADADADTKVQVEESADEDAIRFDTAGVQAGVVNASGNWVFGDADAANDTFSVAGSYLVAKFGIHIDGVVEQLGLAFTQHNLALGPIISLMKSRGTLAAATSVGNNDMLGRFTFYGYDGTDYESGAYIQCSVDGTPGAGDMPGRLGFFVTPDGTAAPVEYHRINNAGGSLFRGYINVAASITTPANTTAGDITGIRFFVNNDSNFNIAFSGASPAITFDTGDLYAYDRTGNQHARYVGGAAVELLTGTGYLTLGYARVGSLSAPTNTTAGDLTATRLIVPNATILHAAVSQLGGPVVIPTQGSILFSDADDSHYVGLRAPAIAQTENYIYELPDDDPVAGQVLAVKSVAASPVITTEWVAAGAGSGHTIRENGTDQTSRTGLNFVDTDAGAGLITDDAGGNETEVNLNLYVLKSVLTTRGDLFRRNATTVERLPVATDRKAVMFDGTDSSYQYVIETGVYASRPAASTANVGRLYMATDRQNTLYRCKDATTWVIVNPRRLRLEWYIDGRQYADDATRQGPIRRIPSDMGPWAPIRATANLKTAPTEGANNTGTATAGSTTTLTDSGKTWTVNQWTGAVCSITAGTGNGKKGRVASNTATVLTFEDAFSAALDATSVYSLESGIRINFESGASATPSTNSFTQPASDTTTDNRLTITPTNVENTASTFNVASYAADNRIEMIIHGVGADANGATGEDLTVVLEIEQTDG